MELDDIHGWLSPTVSKALCAIVEAATLDIWESLLVDLALEASVRMSSLDLPP